MTLNKNCVYKKNEEYIDLKTNKTKYRSKKKKSVLLGVWLFLHQLLYQGCLFSQSCFKFQLLLK